LPFSFNANFSRLSFLCLTVGETCGIIQEVVVSCGWTFLRIFFSNHLISEDVWSVIIEIVASLSRTKTTDHII